MTTVASANTFMSKEEIVDMISEISAAGWIRLRKVAKLRGHGLVDPDVLLQEAFLSAIEGRRTCPNGVDLIRFLAEAMRSIASNEIKSLKRKPELKIEPLINDEGEINYDPPANTPTPEEQIESANEVANIKAFILTLFNDDEIAKFIIEGDMEGIDPAELIDLTGLDKTAYASKRRLIRRRIEKAYPEGWKL